MGNVHEDERLDRFERQTALPMLVLSLAIIPLLVVPLTVDLSDQTEDIIIGIDWIPWGRIRAGVHRPSLPLHG